MYRQSPAEPILPRLHGVYPSASLDHERLRHSYVWGDVDGELVVGHTGEFLILLNKLHIANFFTLGKASERGHTCTHHSCFGRNEPIRVQWRSRGISHLFN